MLGHLRGVTEELEGMRVRELAQASSPPPDLPGLDMSAVPPEFFCPITCQMLVDPVVCTDGFTYERCVPACSVPCLSLHVLCYAMFRTMPACSVLPGVRAVTKCVLPHNSSSHSRSDWAARPFGAGC